MTGAFLGANILLFVVPGLIMLTIGGFALWWYQIRRSSRRRQ